MYSDSSSVVSVFEESSSDTSSWDHEQNLVDCMVDNAEDASFIAETAFFYFFRDPSGPFRRVFPDQYLESTVSGIDLTTVLGEEGNMDEGMDYENNEEKTTTGPDEKEEEAGTGTTTDDVQLSAKSIPVILSSTDGDTAVLKPSPATRFLDKYPDDSLLIPVDLTINRKTLREQHIEQFPEIDFMVGYIHCEPTGWALLLSRDPTTIAGIKHLYPSHRTATMEDKKMFYRSSSSTGGGNPHPFSSPPNPPKNARMLVKRMHDTELLAGLIESIGGIDKVVFVALDVEAALVLRGAVPLPLEIAMVPLTVSEEWQTFHAFIHPGKVLDVVTACRLSCGTGKGNHCIPFRDAAFLRHDYTSMAREIERYLLSGNVVLVNKGTCMDVNAIRWIFGAARVAENSDIRIPDSEEICCFDIETIRELLRPSEGGRAWAVDEDVISNKSSSTDGVSAVASCWYHSKLVPELTSWGTLEHNPHCALQDAESLCKELRSLVSSPVPVEIKSL